MLLERQVEFLTRAKEEFLRIKQNSYKRAVFGKVMYMITGISILLTGTILTFNSQIELPTIGISILGIFTSAIKGTDLMFNFETNSKDHYKLKHKCESICIRITNKIDDINNYITYCNNPDHVIDESINPQDFSRENIEEFVTSIYQNLGEMGLANFVSGSAEKILSN